MLLVFGCVKRMWILWILDLDAGFFVWNELFYCSTYSLWLVLAVWSCSGGFSLSVCLVQSSHLLCSPWSVSLFSKADIMWPVALPFCHYSHVFSWVKYIPGTPPSCHRLNCTSVTQLFSSLHWTPPSDLSHRWLCRVSPLTSASLYRQPQTPQPCHNRNSDCLCTYSPCVCSLRKYICLLSLLYLVEEFHTHLLHLIGSLPFNHIPIIHINVNILSKLYFPRKY